MPPRPDLRGAPARRAWRFLPRRVEVAEAAVAAIVSTRDGEPRVLLVERAARTGDRWSGHVALPGGVRQAEDASTLAAAVRETREEIGLELSPDALIGSLDEAHALAHGGWRPMRVAPFVFSAEPEIGALRLSPEVTAAFWLPLGAAARGELDVIHWHRGRIAWPFRAWRQGGRTVWGLTYGVLRDLVRALGLSA